MSTATRSKRQRYSENDSDSSDAEYKPAVKRPKRVRGKRGGLSKLPEMPMDVTTEIMSYLGPLDLLNLARTSRQFRAFMLSRKSLFLWRAARENMEDYPPCPDDMSEPALANLLLCAFCHGCGRAGCDKIYWDLKARYCNSCASELATRVRSDPYLSEYLKVDIPFPMSHLQPHMLVRVAEEARMARLRARDDGIPPVHGDTYLLSSADLAALKDALLELTLEERYAYVETRAREMQKSRKQLVPLIQWRAEMLRARRNEKEELLRQRYEDVRQRLIDLGWAEELKRIDSRYISTHPLVAQARPLTDRVWNKIEEELVSILKTHKRLRMGQHANV